MKSKISILIAFFILFAANSSFAQNDCEISLITELKTIPSIQTIVQDDDRILAILSTSDKAESIKSVSRIAALHSRASAAGCDYKTFPIAVLNSNLLPVKSKTSKDLQNSDIEKLLYKHVYKVSPLQLEENLKGYTRLAELSPGNSYYAARVAHYKERIDLQNDRINFINQCIKEAAKDKSILDLKINRDAYLFITANDTPQKTALAFLDKVAQITPRPKKELCLFFYDSNLNREGDSCPQEFLESLGNTEESLLMSYVQSIPSQLINQNINGYKALKKLNPSSSLYSAKLESYESKLAGLKRFLNAQTASGQKIFLADTAEVYTLLLTLNDKALEGKSDTAVESFCNELSRYYEYSGSPYPKCSLKTQAGVVLGKIQCTRSGQCRFEK
ncbi:hypothetical protein [Desulfovibrio gilichinskyi]|uniref:Uncharacterized protein n=1 Tax=Desulfovibrio gilichinskyi TaxID=1519643 RepID=A0A1X7E2W3_9BACT|nr:hypothetical protein [Desulfovibrio gilichinskyi]SMF25870.1 hypothetical protein SAMN06295933_2514 [Desulfovibrio gilichinskyi]